MASDFSFDSSEPEWWLDALPMPDEGWTVKGDLMIQGPDDHWIGLHFREGAPTADLIGIVKGSYVEAVANPAIGPDRPVALTADPDLMSRVK